MNLTQTYNMDNNTPTALQEAVRVRLLKTRAQQALNRSAFFYAQELWWAVWRLFGAPSLVCGKSNSVQLTTLLDRLHGGELFTNHEVTSHV